MSRRLAASLCCSHNLWTVISANSETRPNIPKLVAERSRRSLFLDRSHSFVEPDSRDGVSMTVNGSDTDRNDGLPLKLGQLFVVERDDNDPHTTVRRKEKISILVSRTLLAVALLIENTQVLQKTQGIKIAGTFHQNLPCQRWQ